jgi:acyl-CoA thioester hydrolase
MPHETMRIRVAFHDVDSSQRIHFTAMFRYFEIAEHALMRSLGLPYATTLREYAFPRVHLACDFRGPTHYDDMLDVEARVERVGTTSWTIAFRAHQADEGPLVAEGRMTIVAMDPTTERPIPLPAALRAGLEAAG